MGANDKAEKLINDILGLASRVNENVITKKLKALLLIIKSPNINSKKTEVLNLAEELIAITKELKKEYTQCVMCAGLIKFSAKFCTHCGAIQAKVA